MHGQYPEFEGYINAYNSKIFSSEIYISDSRMIFQKDPYEFLKLSRQQLIQFLVHPMHYTDYETTYPSILAHYMLDKIDDLHEMFLVNSQYKEQIGDKQLRDYVKDYIEQGAEH